ncbi:MAG: NYN domain-containing protein, partial [Oscillospiraceae bacterium]
LYSGNCDGFVLVSSDSDFTRLAVRLREAGMKVIGMGERKTPSPFIVACDKFIYIEVIRAAAGEVPSGEIPAEAPGKKTQPKKKQEVAEPVSHETSAPDGNVPAEVVDLIADSLDMIADEDGYAFMGELGNLLIKKQPDFDSRNYGFPKLTQLIKAVDRFEIDARQTSNPHTKHVYLRDKTKR